MCERYPVDAVRSCHRLRCLRVDIRLSQRRYPIVDRMAETESRDEALMFRDRDLGAGFCEGPGG